MLLGMVLLFFAITFAFTGVAVVIAGEVLDSRRASTPGSSGQTIDIARSLFKDEQLSSISAWAAFLARFDFVNIMRRQIGQADLNWSVGRLTLSMLLAGAITLAALSNVSMVPTWAAIGITWLAALGPYAYVLRLRSRRFRAFAGDFPDALDSLSRALKAGYPFIAALDIVSRESTGPVSSEMRKTYVEANLGVEVPRALENLCDRIALVEVELFSAAVQLHSRTGGRLTDVVSILAENMREQAALQGEIRAMAAQGRTTGIVLTLLPVGIAGMMAVVSPIYIGVLLGHPYGKHMIAAAIFCLIVAHFVIRKIVDIRI